MSDGINRNQRSRSEKSQRRQPVYLSGAAANLMLEIWHSSGHRLSGIPVKLAADQHALAEELERNGMIERHHVGSGVGAVATALGAKFVRDAAKHLYSQPPE